MLLARRQRDSRPGRARRRRSRAGAVRSNCELSRNSTSESTSQPATSASSVRRIRFGLAQRRQRVPRVAAGPTAAPASDVRRLGAAAGQQLAARARSGCSSSPRAPQPRGRRGSGCTAGARRRGHGGTLYLPDDLCGCVSRAARRLSHPDRQPRGRDAARARSAARGGRGGLRGHAAHAGAARAARDRGEAGELPRAQRTRARDGAGGADRAGEPWSRSCPTRACRWSPTPASRSCGRASRRACRSRCCRGRAPCSTALVASGLPAERWRFVGSSRARRAERERLLERSRGDARRVRVAAAPGRRRWSSWPSATPTVRWRSAGS